MHQSRAAKCFFRRITAAWSRQAARQGRRRGGLPRARGADARSRCRQGYFYYIFGFCFVVGVLTVLITIEVALVCTYVQLCAEDYLWWCGARLTHHQSLQSLPRGCRPAACRCDGPGMLAARCSRAPLRLAPASEGAGCARSSGGRAGGRHATGCANPQRRRARRWRSFLSAHEIVSHGVGVVPQGS